MSRELPQSYDCFRIGLVSTILFSVTLPLAVSCFYRAVNRYTKKIFLSIVVLTILELPWSLQLVINRRYSGQYVYSLHILACVFYIIIFCVFCFSINDVLRDFEFGSMYVGTIKRKRIRIIMVIGNAITLIVVIAAISILLSADNLNDYFSKHIYKATVLFDAVEVMVLGLCITAFVTKLRGKLTFENQICRSETPSEVLRRKKLNLTLTAVTSKLTWMLVIFMVAFLLKLIQACWWFSPHNNRYAVDVLAPQSMKEYDFWWWLILSLLPRAVPPVVFIIFMGWPSRYLFRNLIPDASVKIRTRTSTSDSSARPRQGTSDSFDGGGGIESNMSFELSTNQISMYTGYSSESDGRHVTSGLRNDNSDRLSMNEDLLPSLHHFSDAVESKIEKAEDQK
jgi:uncharacterized membrane protein YgcG